VSDGVLSRSVADTATMLDLLAGYELGDAAWIPPPAEPFAQTAARPPRGLRIAFTKLPPIPDAPVDAACADAVDRAAALAEGLGHAVEEVDPPWQREDLSGLFGDYFAAQIAAGIFYSAMITGRAQPEPADMEPMSWALWERSRQLDAVGFQVVQNRLQSHMRELVAFLDPYDALLTPALAQRPLMLGSLDTAAPVPFETFVRSGYFTPFTPVFNMSGQPAIALPLYEGDDGLPLAVQLVGRPGGEGPLLALAGALEQAASPIPRRPLIS
jgi:amidase